MAADGFSGFGGFDGFAGGARTTLRPEEEIERSVLAAVLMNGAILDALPDGLGARHFRVAGHSEIWEAAVAARRHGDVLLAMSVQQALPDEVVSHRYIREVSASAISLRPDDVAGFARLLMESADRQALLDLSDTIRAQVLARDGARRPNAGIVSEAASGLEAIAAGQFLDRPDVLLDEAVDAAIEAGKLAAARGGLAGISTGFRCIDQRLGGLEPGCLYILGARPAIGKTALALQIALAVAGFPPGAEGTGEIGDGLPVFVGSLEMAGYQLGRRALALASGVNGGDLKSGAFTLNDRMAEAVVRGRQILRGLPLAIADKPRQRMDEIRVRAKAARRRFGRLAVVVIDHLHIVGKPAEAGRHGNTYAITEISGAAKALAKELEVPVLLLAQLNRGLESREDKRPGLADLRESGAVEQDADAVMFLHREEYFTAKGPQVQRKGESAEMALERRRREVEHATGVAGKAEIIFGKVRDGEVGTEHVGFDGARTRFYEEQTW